MISLEDHSVEEAEAVSAEETTAEAATGEETAEAASGKEDIELGTKIALTNPSNSIFSRFIPLCISRALYDFC